MLGHMQISPNWKQRIPSPPSTPDTHMHRARHPCHSPANTFGRNPILAHSPRRLIENSSLRSFQTSQISIWLMSWPQFEEFTELITRLKAFRQRRDKKRRSAGILPTSISTQFYNVLLQSSNTICMLFTFLTGLFLVLLSYMMILRTQEYYHASLTHTLLTTAKSCWQQTDSSSECASAPSVLHRKACQLND